MNDVIILGSGPAGWTAAVYAARAGLSPVVITGIQPGGQLTTTTDVDNWPADAKGVLGNDLMTRFQEHAERFETKVIYDHIASVSIEENSFDLIGDSGQYQCRSLIVATGATAKYIGLPSEEAFMGRGVSACATCDGFFYKNKPVAVVGGGNTAVEEALYLSNIASSVTLIHRRETFRAEKILQDHLYEKVKKGKIQLQLSSTVDEIVGNDSGVTGIRVNQKDRLQDIIVDGVFIAIGHSPNTSLFKNIVDMSNDYILTKGGHQGMATATSVNGIFAAGDVQDSVYRQAVTSSASGCMAALDVKKYLENL